MKSYLIKYSISFSDYDTPSRGEWLVKDGLEFYDENEEEWSVVNDEESAGDYLVSLYYHDEYKLVSVPPEVSARDEGLGDTEFKVESVSTRELD